MAPHQSHVVPQTPSRGSCAEETGWVWVENSLGNIAVRPSGVTESITHWQGVLPPATALLCASALCCQGTREERGSVWDECVCQQSSALNQSLSTICLRRTQSLEPLRSKGSAWPCDELGRCHFGWLSSIELGHIQVMPSKVNSYNTLLTQWSCDQFPVMWNRDIFKPLRCISYCNKNGPYPIIRFWAAAGGIRQGGFLFKTACDWRKSV